MMKAKAKTNTRLITILNTFLGVVFAIIMGVTYCTVAFTKSENTNYNSTASYLAPQSWKVINGTTESPIPFGQGAHNTEVSIEYSIPYSFDIRVKYSLTWNSTTLNAENVILNYANRDMYIVDGATVVDDETDIISTSGYIYYKDALASGHNTLKIFTGVDFADPYDENYFGSSLSISIDEVKIYKANATTYNDSHPLYNNSIAGKAWENYKTTGGDAQVIVYNYRASVNNGIVYPDGATAYKRVSGVATAALYGNKFYAGVGLYVIAGASPIKLTAQAIGSWVESENGQAAGTAFDNNVRFKYNSDWTIDSDDENHFKHANYNYTIPANTACYIQLLDNVEITCVMNTLGTDYSDYKLISNINVNGVDFGTSLISTETITTSTDDDLPADTTVKTSEQNKYTIINNSTYTNGLYVVGGGAQNYYTNLSYTNNTNTAQTITTSYTLKYYYSNGKTDASDWRNTESSTTNSTYFTASADTYTIAPYSTVLICDTFTLSDDFSDLLNENDAWVELVPTINFTGSKNTALNLETKVVGSTITYSLKNTSNSIITNPTGTISHRTINYNYETVTVTEDAFESEYWIYYYKNASGKYVRSTKSTVWSNNTQFYTRSMVVGSAVSKSVSYTGTIYPNESVVIGTATTTANINYLFGYNITGTTSTPSGIEIVNEGTTNASIVNYSSSSYYVRFGGTLSETNNVIKSGSYNYFIGIVRPGQILDIKMSATGTLDIIKVEGNYSSSTLTGWKTTAGATSSTTTPDDIKTAFEEYFAKD
ncbi:MAG: hypothetical protein IKM43_04355 [Clostridia bacterium]|nr:hypothetical protein [Clostridia bacterium]